MFSKALNRAIAALAIAAATPWRRSRRTIQAIWDMICRGPRQQSCPPSRGDDAFAAIAEIVAMLSADPETDWNRVDIDGLRAHLVDMNVLVLGASVRSEPVPDGLRMRVGTAGRPGEAASRMVPAHGPVLAAETGWQSEVTRDGPEIVWTVRGAAAAAAVRIQALGFFGLMATGDHHRAHHLAMAKGEAAH